MTFLQIAFWSSAAAIVLTYCLYPLILWIIGRRRPISIQSQELPTVSLVISAYNEQKVIQEKLNNSLLLDYPKNRLEVIVISDESTDLTDRIVKSFAHQQIKLFRQEPRQGKSAGLTRFAPLANGELIVFSDANSMYAPDAIRKLVRHFGDPSVGFVVGHQRYVDELTSSSVAESLYWKYETALKIRESRIGSVVCGDGAIYAIRSRLFEPLLPDDINDFTLPLGIVTRGYRGVFDEEAICYERAAETFAGEFRRKVRIVNRSMRAVLRVAGCVNPARVGWFAARLLVHKVLRWFVPFLLLMMLVCSAFLAATSDPLYWWLLIAQVVFYSVAVLHVIPACRRWKPVYVAYYFCVVNVAAAVGIAGALIGRSVSIWQPERLSDQRRPMATSSGLNGRT